jgi:hypothetical protein
MSETVLVNFFCDEHLLQVAKSLCKKNKDRYKFSFCHRLPNKNIRQFDHVNFFDATLLYNVNNFKIAFKNLTPISLDIKEHDFLLSGYRYVFKSFDRMTVYPCRIGFYDEYFWELASYYKSFFKKNSRIKNIIFDQTPHLSWDIILFFVAKMCGIKTLILKRTSIAGVAYIIEDFRDENLSFQFRYQKYLKTINLNQEGKEILAYLRKNNFTNLQTNGEWNWTCSRSYIPEVIKKYLFYKILSDCYRFIRSFFEKIPSQKEGASKEKINSKFSIGKKLSRLMYIKFKFGYLLRRFQNFLSDRNNENFKDLYDKKENFIFFALHFEPERSTNPDGLFFSDQLIAIKMLSQNIPDSYKIYVKEHPKQLNFDLRNDHYRSVDFYKNLKTLKNVRMLASNSNYNDLIKNSFCTATITGSITWDGLLQGKPGVVFTNSYLANCESVGLIQSNNDVSKVLNNLMKKKQRDVFDDIINFLKINERHFINAIIYSPHRNLISPEKYDEYLENLVSCIDERLL